MYYILLSFCLLDLWNINVCVHVLLIPRHQGIPGNEEANRLAKEGAIEVSPNHFAAIPFSVGKNLIRKQLEQKHQARWTACTGCRQSKVLMRYSLPSRASELLAMSKLRLRLAVGLLTGYSSLRAHLHKLGHTERQECRLCRHYKEDSVHIVCDCPVLACIRYGTWGCIFLKPEDLENVRVSSLLSLVAKGASTLCCCMPVGTTNQTQSQLASLKIHNVHIGNGIQPQNVYQRLMNHSVICPLHLVRVLNLI
jgi:hypothetical protein